MSKKIFYLNYYTEEQGKGLNAFFSCVPKVEYIVSKLENIYDEIEIVSAASSSKGLFWTKHFKLKPSVSLKYFFSFHGNNRLMRIVNAFLLRCQILFFLLINVKKCDTVLVYHSLFYASVLKLYKKLTKHKFCLEIEDVFTSVNASIKDKAPAEWNFFQYGDSYICVNDLLKEKLPQNKRAIVSYGSYLSVSKMEQSHEGELVYAGIIERYRYAAFLAAEAMLYLDENYHLSIYGFGTDDDLEYLKSKIERINDEKGYECVSYFGKLTGDDYYRALQKCEIALSTHRYDDNNMKSADDTFPSKLLVYLANNLKIVAQRIECLEQSELAKHIVFYDDATPENVATAIRIATQLPNEQKGSDLIARLDREFGGKLEYVLQI